MILKMRLSRNMKRLGFYLQMNKVELTSLQVFQVHKHQPLKSLKGCLTIKPDNHLYDFLVIGFGPITDALTKKLTQEKFSVALVSNTQNATVGIPVISRSQMIAEAHGLSASTVVLSTRLDRWDSQKDYEDFIKSVMAIRPKRIILLSSV